MTEPLKGSISGGDWTEFIPSHHVRYLEQTGSKVVPLSYKLSNDDLIKLLDQVSGVYIPGDSIEAPTDKRFAATYANILSYAFEHNHEKSDYFPVIMLGSIL